ncbi:MAG: ROK family protein [Lachnospiraceae bacterium]|nr:ROK family protein [Lachnospiraceae bacterium]
MGGGIILNNQVVKGSHMAAGELSCCLINRDVEGISMDNVIAMRFAVPGLLKMYRDKTGAEETLDGVEFFRRANEGEEAALETLRYFCRVTATYFYDLQVILDVDCIAVGGGISAQTLL